MPWANARPGGNGTAEKYRKAEHTRTRRRLEQQLDRDGLAYCQQPRCLMPSRLILPGMDWHAGHDDTGTRYIGHVHARCNVSDGGRRARQRQTTTARRM